MAVTHGPVNMAVTHGPGNMAVTHGPGNMAVTHGPVNMAVTHGHGKSLYGTRAHKLKSSTSSIFTSIFESIQIKCSSKPPSEIMSFH